MLEYIKAKKKDIIAIIVGLIAGWIGVMVDGDATLLVAVAGASIPMLCSRNSMFY